MKKLLLSIICSTVAMASYAYESAYKIEDLNLTKYSNLKHLVNSTYVVYYIHNSTSYAWHAIAINENTLLTSAHNLDYFKIGSSRLIISDINEESKEDEYKISEISRPINNTDLAIIKLDHKLPLSDYVNKFEIETDPTLLTKDEYGSIFALGFAGKFGEGFAKKLTGGQNFYTGSLPDVYTSESSILVASQTNTDANHDQIAAVKGDSGGPWFICDDINKECKLVAIQSWRGDMHEDEKYHKYRSVAVPLDNKMVE